MVFGAVLGLCPASGHAVPRMSARPPIIPVPRPVTAGGFFWLLGAGIALVWDARGTWGTGGGRPPVAPTFAVINGAPTEHGAGRDTVTQGVALGYINILPRWGWGVGLKGRMPTGRRHHVGTGGSRVNYELRINNYELKTGGD